MRREDLRPISLFDGLDDTQLGELLEAGEEVSIEDGVELFREGQTMQQAVLARFMAEGQPRDPSEGSALDHESHNERRTHEAVS